MWPKYVGVLCNNYKTFCNEVRDGAVIEALRYKPEGCGIDSRRCHWNFSLIYSFLPHYGPGVELDPLFIPAVPALGPPPHTTCSPIGPQYKLAYGPWHGFLHYFQIICLEDGTDIMFRNVGQYKPDAGETPKFSTLDSFRILCSSSFSHAIFRRFILLAIDMHHYIFEGQWCRYIMPHLVKQPFISAWLYWSQLAKEMSSKSRY
jgi:hypothetical protein